MQKALLGAAIALILVLMTALVGPLFVDWGHYRDTFEAEISRLTQLDVRIGGSIDVRLLPAPTLKLHQIEIGRREGPFEVRAEALQIELALGALMRGQLVASDVALEAPEISLRLGRAAPLELAAPAHPALGAGESRGGAFAFDPDAVAINHFAIEKGRVILAGGSGRPLLLDRVGFSGEVRSLLGPAKGDGSVAIDGESYLFSIAASRVAADGAVKARLLVDTPDRVRVGDVDTSIWTERGIPHFAGAVQWSQAAGRSVQGAGEPWRLSAKMRGDWTAAALEGINLQYGSEDQAIQLRGHANLTFRAKPELDVMLAATRIDLDRMLALPAAARRRPLAALRTMADNFDAARLPPVRVNLAISADAVTLADAPLQDLSAALRGEGGAWDLDSLDLRAPGGTQLKLRGRLDFTPRGTDFAGQGRIEARDSRALVSWLTAGSDGEAFAGPFRAEGDVRLGRESIVFDRVKAEFDHDTLAGNFAYFAPVADRPGRIAATLSASNIDLDRAYAFVQRISGDTALGWPHEGSLSLTVSRTAIAGVEARGTDMRLQFDERALTVERLGIDDFGGARVTAAGSFDLRTLAPRGAIRLDLDMRAADGVALLVEKFSPPAAAALRRNASRLLPARLQGSVAGDAHAAREAGMAAGASFKIDGAAGPFTFDLQGVAEVASDGSLLATFAQPGNVVVTGRVDARDGRTLVEAAGLDRLVSVDEQAGRLNFKASGRTDGPVAATAHMTAGGLDVSIDGTLQAAQSQGATANLLVTIARANLRVPQAATLPTALTARLQYADGAVALNEIAGTVGGSAITGRLAIGPTPTMILDGDIKLGAVDVPSVIAAAVGSPPRRGDGGSGWPADPFAAGVLGQFRGRVATASAQTLLTPNLVAENLRGVLNFGPSGIALDDFEADMARGRVSGRLALERNGDELGVRSSVKLTKADMTALVPGDREPVSGRLNVDAEIEGRGRSPAALIGSLQGKGSFSIEDGKLARLDPSAFDAVIRSVDQGLPIEVTRIRERMEEALGRGPLPVQGGGAITAQAGNASLAASRLRAEGADVAVSARYDLVGQALDARLALVGPAGKADTGRPEIAVILQGSLDSPRRTLDIAALVDWLQARAIAENAKRLAALSPPVEPRRAEQPPPWLPGPRPVVPPEVAKPEPAPGEAAAGKPESPANPPAAAKPPPPLQTGEGTEGGAATKPATPIDLPKPMTPTDLPPAPRDAAAIPEKPNPAPTEPSRDPRIAELDRAIAVNPSDRAALAERGQKYALLGNYGSAIKDFDEVIRLRPQDAEAFNNRCWARTIIGDLQSALNDCNAALQLNPRYADAFDSRGLTNLKSAQLGKAIADYDEALRIEPNRPSSLYGRGIARIRNGNPAAGTRDIADAKRLQPNIVEEFAGYGIR